MPVNISKKEQIINYINTIASQLNAKYDNIINEEKLTRAIEMFKDSQESYEDIIKKINYLVEQMIDNYLKEKEKRFNPELVKKNHEEIYNKLEILTKKLNERGIDYQLAGALCAYLKYDIESNRTHDDIDINLNEKDMTKFKIVCEEMGLIFHDNRLTTSRVLKNGIPAGEHEVIATLDNSDFHIGAFCFERNPDGTVINKGYYHDENGNICSRNDNISQRLANEIFGREQIIFRGQKIFITPPEYIYKLKSYTQNDKDKVDLNFMKSRIDQSKLARINELSNEHHVTHEIVKEVNLSKSHNYSYTYKPEKEQSLAEEVKELNSEQKTEKENTITKSHSLIRTRKIDNKGFTNILEIILIITFISALVVLLTYIINKI